MRVRCFFGDSAPGERGPETRPWRGSARPDLPGAIHHGETLNLVNPDCAAGLPAWSVRAALSAMIVDFRRGEAGWLLLGCCQAG